MMFTSAQEKLPEVVSGKIERFADFKSKYVTARNVDVWLPSGYSPKKRYAVLYMHDGQMLYDAQKSWNKQAWDVDDVASKLMTEKRTKNFIIVGIWNGGETRHRDYFPQKAFESLNRVQKDTINNQLRKAGRSADDFKPNSDNYLKFIVKELKPFIDKKYGVSQKQADTYIAGSSMGGLISMYAICEYPEIFGGAACLSTHWPGTFSALNNPIPDSFISYLKTHIPDPKNHKIYFDCGDQTLDAMYPEIQKKVDAVMISKAYTQKNWKTEFFMGANHSEDAWKSRLHIPLEFLLGKE